MKTKDISGCEHASGVPDVAHARPYLESTVELSSVFDSDANGALEALAAICQRAVRSQTFIRHLWSAVTLHPLMVRDDHLAELARIPHITNLAGFSDFQTAVRRENGVLLEDLLMFWEKAREGVQAAACGEPQAGLQALMALQTKNG